MSETQSKAARERHRREAETVCPICEGSGRILTANARTRARKGGNAAYQKSKESGQLSMSERGRRGGRPRGPTLATLEAS